MNKPIQAGDLAEVISGMLGEKSPNKGLIVKVIHRVYECQQLGVIWRCEAEYAVQHDTTRVTAPGVLDFAQDWLRKIEPPPLPAEALTKELVTVHTNIEDAFTDCIRSGTGIYQQTNEQPTRTTTAPPGGQCGDVPNHGDTTGSN